jgi:hypothetical protein
LPTTHLLPGIYKNGKMYLPDLKLDYAPKRENPDSIQLSAVQWISKSDTLKQDNAPTLKVVYQSFKVKSEHQFLMSYRLVNQDNIKPDSIVYSIWKSKWKESPYETRNVEPTWDINAPEFESQEFKHDLMKPEGRGAFTALPSRTDLKIINPEKDLKWSVKLIFP